MDSVARLRDVATRLRALQASSPTTSDALNAWNGETRGFEEWLEAEVPGLRLPAQVWMYLHDADIRVKDPAYRAAQDEMLDRIISEFECGRVPESTGIAIPLNLRWLGVGGLLLLAVAVYLFST